MKNYLRNILAISLVFGLFTVETIGQVDQERMQRDIRVASGILQTLSQADDTFVMYGDNVSGEYIDGYGVMFSVGGGYSFVAPRAPRGRAVIAGSGRSRSTAVWSDEDERAVAKAKAEGKEKEDIIDSKKSDIKEVMTLFLVDYSQLIGQLSGTDKIVVSTKKSDYFYYYKTEKTELMMEPPEGSGNNGLTAELLKKDHQP